MNILFLNPDHSLSGFGITTIVSQLADHLSTNYPSINIYIATVSKDIVKQNSRVKVEKIQPSRIGTSWRWSPDLISTLDEIIRANRIDIIHLHGVWAAIHWAGLTLAKKYDIPVIISPHGMLEPWLWNDQGKLKKLKKSIYMKLVFHPALPKTVYFHAITSLEKENLLNQFPGRPIEVIPNAFDLDSYDRASSSPDKQILFLGRLHPKKGIELLIKAFSNIPEKQGWKLVISGPEDYPNYLASLINLSNTSGVSDYTKFTGPVWGQEKEALIKNSWIMVVPSYSEVIGMVNLEAAAYKVPSITTYQTGLSDWQNGGGYLVNPVVDELQNALDVAMNWTIEERLARGNMSYNLFLDNYSWNSVLEKWTSFYTKIKYK
jgi:glycosyltransferase involved in cell wall biosynthesis